MEVSVKLEPEVEDTINTCDEFGDDIPDIKNINTKSEPNVSNNSQLITPCEIPETNRTTITNSQPKRKSTGKRRNTDEFTTHFKKYFLKMFHKEGCSPQTIEKYCKKYNIKIEDVNEFYGEAAREAQQYVYQECDSFSFNNITEWLKYFQAKGVSEQCNFEPAIVMNAILNNEYHPESNVMEGICLRSIYKFLSNGLMGLPQEPLNEASSIFLANEFQNLISEANTDSADNDVRNMKTKIEYSLANTPNRKKRKLDPLNTMTNEI